MACLHYIMTNDHDGRFLQSLIGGEVSGDSTSFCNTRSLKIEVTMDEHVEKWMRNDMKLYMSIYNV